MVSQDTVLVQGIDLGNDRSVSSILSGPPYGQPVLVRNNLANDSTPTAVAFSRGQKRCVGDAATEQPASNAANVVSRFLPNLGKSEGVSVGYGPDGEATTLSHSHCLAMFLRELQQHAKVQKSGAEPTHFVLSVPPAFDDRQIRAVWDAACIAGLPNVSIARSSACLAYHYAERHGPCAFPPAAADGEGGEGGKPIHVLFVDVGHRFSSAFVASYAAEKRITIVSCEGTQEVGGEHVDQLLMAHFTQDLAAKHGADSVQGSKYEIRCARACEKLKKLLSTVDAARVDADSLIPDHDCSLALKRKDLEHMIAPMLAKLDELIKRVLASAGDVEISGLEVVGGGLRVPCVLEAVKKASGQASSRHTLDSSAACAFGAASLAKVVLCGGGGGEGGGKGMAGAAAGGGDAAESCEGGEGKTPPAAEEAVITMEGAFVDVVGEGMSAEQLAEAVEAEGRMREEDQKQRAAQDAKNALESWVYRMRGELAGRSGALLAREVVEEMMDALEEWLCGEGEDLEAAVYVEKLEASVSSLRAECPEYYAQEQLLKAEEAAKELEEEKRRRMEEELNRTNEDHDNRVLKFADRYAMAEKNKNEGNELFKDGNCKFAAERYVKALGHLAKLVHVENTMKQADHDAAKALKLSCCNNLAQCFLKLEMWQKAVDNCNTVIDWDKNNNKAYFRRAQAYLGLKENEKAREDLNKCLQLNADDQAVVKLLEKTEKTIKASEAKQKKVYSKMFG